MTLTRRALLRTSLLVVPGLAAACGPQVRRPGWPGATSQEQVLLAMQLAWSRGAVEDLAALFWSPRRALVRAHAAALRARMARWQITGWQRQPICHPRGDAFELVYVRMKLENLLDPQADAIDHDEAIWLTLQRGRWWLYSL